MFLETIIPLKQEMEFLDDRFSYIKYQIEGAKKKYLYDMKRIEEMDKLNSMRKFYKIENLNFSQFLGKCKLN